MNDDQLKIERNRFLILNLVRISGAVFILLGIAIISRGFLDQPKEVGYGIFFVGIVDFIFAPLVLARAWKTPTDL